jgi:HEAT repeat protein
MNSLDEAMKRIATYEFGQSRQSLIEVAGFLRDSYGDPDRRKELRSRLTALLSSDATADCKRFVCEQLSIIGTAQEVPALANLLTDENLSHMARLALERIPDAAAAAALRDALPRAKGRVLIGIINSLGVRRDDQAVEHLTPLLADPDQSLAAAAAAALGKIGGPEAASALDKAKTKASPKLHAVIADALLACAEGFLARGKNEEAAKVYQGLSGPGEIAHVRAAAIRGLKSAPQK